MLACFRRHKQNDKKQSTDTLCTIIHYKKDEIPHALMIYGGPGDSITLTNEEYLAIVKEVDVPMYVGASFEELTEKKILTSPTFQKILEELKERTPLQSPRATKRKP
ncbi:hypothetical protein [Candidatus Berkiella aquae]|uniref:Uncharacterized protein n=1 Tax=Candidatus Berkiella aquae TaxID=295108 RepID=A0A0Q9YM62_9GAMM|nr:hypothetical protein [Candidatus Berkiella aquae]MCS5710486.1 hypothetical protein [Candidatus Berkiella aquae]